MTGLFRRRRRAVDRTLREAWGYWDEARRSPAQHRPLALLALETFIRAMRVAEEARTGVQLAVPKEVAEFLSVTTSHDRDRSDGPDGASVGSICRQVLLGRVARAVATDPIERVGATAELAKFLAGRIGLCGSVDGDADEVVDLVAEVVTVVASFDDLAQRRAVVDSAALALQLCEGELVRLDDVGGGRQDIKAVLRGTGDLVADGLDPDGAGATERTMLLSGLRAGSYRLERGPEDFIAARDLLRGLLIRHHPDPQVIPDVGEHLAFLWHDRWNLEADPAALDEAVVELWRVVHARPGTDGVAARARLGRWLFERHQISGRAADLREAAQHLLQAVDDSVEPDALLQSNAVMTGLAGGLLESLAARRRATSVLAHLALDDEPKGEPTPAQRYANLAQALVALHEVSGDRSDLGAALNAAASALSGVPDDRAVFVAMTAVLDANLRLDRYAGDSRLARLHVARARRAASTASDRAIVDRLELLSECSAVEGSDVTTADLRLVADMAQALAQREGAEDVRRDAARAWAELARRSGRPDDAVQAYTLLLSLMTDDAWWAADTPDRLSTLDNNGSPVQDAAHCAILDGAPVAALGLMEFGQQILRRPRPDRRYRSAQLRGRSERVDRLLGALRGLDMLERSEREADYLQGISLVQLALPHESEVHLRRATASLLARSPLPQGGPSSDGDELIGRIADRKPELRAAFLAELDELARSVGAAVDEPASLLGSDSAERLVERLRSFVGARDAVVAVNTGPLGSHAVVVTRAGIKTVPLDGLKAIDLLTSLEGLWAGVFGVDDGVVPHEDGDGQISRTLDHLWRSVVQPVLTALTIECVEPGEETRPRIWWFLQGALRLLPMHAARSATGSAAHDAMNLIVSSYTSSLSALLRPTQDPATATAGPASILALAPPNAVGLPAVRREIATVRGAAMARGMTVNPQNVGFDDVLSLFDGASWLHAACHGTPAADSVPAGLVIDGGFLSTARLAWAVNGPAELAYLSSCHSALSMQNPTVAPEHLAAEFQEAGFRHVIATAWAAGDRVAERVAELFYEHLGGQGLADASGSAEALNRAVRALRAERPGCSPALWAPFQHFGP